MSGVSDSLQIENEIESKRRSGSTAYKIDEDSQTEDLIGKGNVKGGKEINESFSFTMFVFIGMIQLIGWNALLNMIIGVLISIGYSLDTSSITAVYSTLNLLGTLACTYWADFFIRPIWTYVGLTWTGLNAIIFAVVIYAKSPVAFALLHVLAGSMGIAACLTGCSAFGYANYFPQNYGGAVSAGLGVAGTVTFVLWMLAKHAFFPSNVEGTQGSSWFLNSFVAGLSVVTLVMALYFFKQPQVKAIIKKGEVEKKQLNQKETQDDENLDKFVERETMWETVKATGLLSSNFFLTMFITLFCFPTIGPFNWGKNEVTNDILVGIFQVGDLVGRYAPNYLKWTLLKKKAITIATYLRFVFIVTFVLSFALKDNAFFGSTIFLVIQMIALSVTNGWLITCCFMRIPEFVQSNIAKARSGTIGLFAVLLGIFVGQWGAYFATLK